MQACLPMCTNFVPGERCVAARPGVYLVQTADVLDDLKLGNGTSILITANIASALPTSVGAAVQQAATRDASNLAVYALALFATTLGVVYVQVGPAHRSLLPCQGGHLQRQGQRCGPTAERGADVPAACAGG